MNEGTTFEDADLQVVALMINFCDAERTIRCINSLIDDVAAVIVWDNSADDGSSAKEIEHAFTESSKVRVSISPENLGFAMGVNRALAVCAQIDPRAFVLVINNDAAVRTDGVLRLREALINNPQAVLAFPDISHRGVVAGPSYYFRPLGLICRAPGWGRFVYPSGCCLLLAPNRLSMHWFDEDFFMYGEDCELGWRLRDRENSMIHVAQTLIDHEGSASSVAGSVFYETRMCAAHWLLAAKTSSGAIDRAVLYFGRAITLPLRALVRSIRYRSLNPWVGLQYGTRLAFDQIANTKVVSSVS